MLQIPDNYELVRYLYYYIGAEHITKLTNFVNLYEHIIMNLADSAIAFTNKSDCIFDESNQKTIEEYINRTVGQLEENFDNNDNKNACVQIGLNRLF